MNSYPEMDLTAYDTPAKKKRAPKPRVERAPKTHEVVAVVGVGQRRFDGPAPVRLRGEPRVDMRKQSLYMPAAMLVEVAAEAERLDRSLSWVIQTAWRLAGPTVKRLPSQHIPGDS